MGQPVGVRAMGQTRPARTFWWDREPSADADIARDVHTGPGAGLVDLVMSLFCAGIWVGVVSTRRRECVETLVRQLIGDGLVETIVTVDDLPDMDAGPASDAELYRLALWELGIT